MQQLKRPSAAVLVFAVVTTVLSIPCRAQEAGTPWSARPVVVEKFQGRRGPFNYDESKVPDYTLPNPLVAANGTLVSSAEAWDTSRREELINLFRDHVYGRRPDVEYSVRFEKTAELKGAFDGAATGRSMTATITIAARTYSFPFVLFVPNNATGPVSAVVHINNRYFVPLEKAASERDPFWPAQTLIERGYATASFHTSDVDPDKKDGYAQGIRAFFANGQPPTEGAWRSLSAWGWAASRVLDHLDSLEAVDGSRVAVVGHSRGGKTSLWAACEDPRFAIAYSNNSGCGGAALSRRAYGETVGRITTSFPHWFCKPFFEYADRESELPVDQHEVIGLIAPRGVYVASADEDLWADPKGEYASVVAAAPVFQLFGNKSITESQMPALNQPRFVGQTGYHIRTGGHGLGDVDWNWFLDFADRLFRRETLAELGWLPGKLQAGDNWPQFRGPGALGVSDNAGLPDTWSEADRVAWKTPIPGRAWSSPVVWGERIFVTTAIKEGGELEEVKKGLYFGGDRPAPKEVHRWKVYCLDLDTGSLVWEREVHRGVPEYGHHLKNTLASETPVCDDERVYAYIGNVGLFCFDFSGKPLWSKRWESIPTRHGWGTAASPVLHGDRIYVVNDNDKESFLVALDKRTGEQIWRVEREEKSNWSTPFVWKNKERTEIVTPGTGKIRSYDLDGQLLWQLGGMSTITIPTPFTQHGLLFITSGYVMDKRKPLYAIRPGAKGDITLQPEQTANEYVAWCQRQAGPYNTSPIVYGDYLYVLYDRGLIACFDAKTGEEIYRKRRIGRGASAFTSSPWAYNGKLFCLSEDGDTFVIKAGPEFELLGKNSLGELCMATPAIIGDGLIIRTESHLLRIK